jgi:hypothetical protein
MIKSQGGVPKGQRLAQVASALQVLASSLALMFWCILLEKKASR